MGTEGEGLRGKLRRLDRRSRPGSPESTGAGIPDWLRGRLARRGRRGIRPQGPGAGGPAPTVDPPERLVELENEAGAFAARIEDLAASARHGDWRLDEVDHVEEDAFALFAADGSLARLDLRRAVYLDIETTGLSGGAGVYPFLVALGTFEGGRFRLWQGFLREPGEERSMLAEVAQRIRRAAAMVSFFGKSFDRHRLEDKMRLHGLEPPFAGMAHLDLYHPLVRLYRATLPDGRLATLEAELCGVRRGDDLPGSLAPAAWFDYLAGRRHRLEAVFRHNRDDVLSLVTLAAHLGRVQRERRHDGRELRGSPGARARGLARLHIDRRQRREAMAWTERAIARSPETSRPLDLQRAELARALGHKEVARRGYRGLAREGDDEVRVRALIGLARLAERVERDPAAAASLCARAREVLERVPDGSARLDRELRARQDRLAARRSG